MTSTLWALSSVAASGGHARSAAMITRIRPSVSRDTVLPWTFFPLDRTAVFDPLMARLGYDSNDTSVDTTKPSGIRNVACAAILDFRHKDGSNQLGTLTSSGVPYVDYIKYIPVNPPTVVPVNPFTVIDVNHWQTLQCYDASGTFVTQKFVGAQWGKVIPFALTYDDQFRDQISRSGPALFDSPRISGGVSPVDQNQRQLNRSRKNDRGVLGRRSKFRAAPEALGPVCAICFREGSSRARPRRKAILCADERHFRWKHCRLGSQTCLRFRTSGHRSAVHVSGTEDSGLGWAIQGDGRNGRSEWIPYQPSTFPTPPFPEYISGHSTFSAAGAEILRLFTRCDEFGHSVSFPAGSSKIEPGLTPAEPVRLFWRTFTDAASQAGISRRYGGIHFEAADLVGRVTGRHVALRARAKAVSLWSGGTSERSDR